MQLILSAVFLVELHVKITSNENSFRVAVVVRVDEREAATLTLSKHHRMNFDNQAGHRPS